MPSTSRFAAGLLITAVLLGSTASAEDGDNSQNRRDDLGYRMAIDLPVTLGAAGFWFATEAMKARLAPAECRFCAPNRLDRSVRDAVVWNDTKAPGLASDVLLYGIAPVAALATTLVLAGADDRLEQAGIDVLLIAEATALSAAMNQMVKFAIGRERPFAHLLAADQKQLVSRPADNNLAFYSGHTAVTFTLASATATVASMRGYRWAKWAWWIGMPVAGATGYLRMAADKHYLTDVVAGAVIGTAAGVLIPALHDWEAFRGRATATVIPLPKGGGMLAFSLGI